MFTGGIQGVYRGILELQPYSRDIIHSLTLCTHQKENLSSACLITVEPPYNEEPRDWKKMFAMTRFHCVEVFLYICTTLKNCK